ncbi:MAG: phytanoyl-CoA dioxygenase family protein [Pseudomonadota bacterium]|nr:phytanoyl-CoA dioxygenase family protein [Pseudomonadota bacterium]MEC8059236.1 phytanoyl-CoA dioxygenase family protein [Pseudomonadota bacterium]
MTNTPQIRLSDTLPANEISAELLPVVEQLGIRENCEELATNGWTILQNAVDPDFVASLRRAIVDRSRKGYANMLLDKDEIFVAATMHPKLMAMAEFSVGRGFLLSQVAASVRHKGSPCIGLHADHNWLPAPFPSHNMLLTACWACDEYSEATGATLIVPGSGAKRRHPSQAECDELRGAVPIECSAGSVVLWDGNLWHSNYPRTVDGERVVCHVTYSRLMMRPVENYSVSKERLINMYGDRMAQLLGEDDFLDSPNGVDYSKLLQTFNNAKR